MALLLSPTSLDSELNHFSFCLTRSTIPHPSTHPLLPALTAVCQAAGKTHCVRKIIPPYGLFPLCLLFLGQRISTVSSTRPVPACCNILSEMFVLGAVPDPSPPIYWRDSFTCPRQNSSSLSNLPLPLLTDLRSLEGVGGGSQ